MRRVRIRPWLAALIAAALVLPALAAWLGVEPSEGLRVQYVARGESKVHELTVEAAWDASAGLARTGQVVVRTTHPRQPQVVLMVHVLYLGA
jgi:hypothetical protein